MFGKTRGGGVCQNKSSWWNDAAIDDVVKEK